jgi:enoyl-CoA hydratase
MLRAMAGTVLYEAGEGVATLTLNRPDRLNTITPELVEDLRAALGQAWDDPAVHAIRLRGAGRSFCAGYDISWGAESMEEVDRAGPWDPIADYQGMSRFVDAYMALWRSPKPVIAQVHGFCVGGGTDFALCSDLIVCAEDCRIGYPPARVWGSPTTAMWTYRIGLERSKRLLLTGDPVDGRTAVEWGLASEAVPPGELDSAALALARRVARLPKNQLHMMKLLVNQVYEQMGLSTTQLIGTLLDGTARHTPEGTDFSRRAAEDVRRAVRDRDAPFGDYGQEPRERE